MAVISNNSIIIPPESRVEQSYGPFYDRSDKYDVIDVGSGSCLTGSYTFSGVNAEKMVIHERCNISGFGVFSRIRCRDLEVYRGSMIYGPYSFQYCSYLNRVKFYENVIITGTHSFSCCSMTELIFGKGMYLNGTGIFFSCKNIEHLEIPDNSNIKGHLIFSQCVNLKTIRFGNNITIEGIRIFSLCESLESIYFGDNVSVYGQENFDGCPNITTIEHGANFLNEDETLRIFQKPYKRVRFEEVPEGTECSILREPFDEQSDVVQTICGHYFNNDGLCNWFKRNNTCPMCREMLKC
jgi:hypothetical protein